MEQKKEGIYNKFHVARIDRRDIPPAGDRQDAEYFVLDLTYDPFALAALRAYARACHGTHPKLSLEVLNKVHEREEKNRGRTGK